MSKSDYLEGFHAGKDQGHRQGIKDALLVFKSILEHNGIIMKESEFWIEYETLQEEGVIK